MHLLTAEDWTAAMTARRPLATDDFSRGMYRMDKTTALGKRHVQMNSPYLLRALVFDVDRDDAAREVQSLAWDTESIPEPSWITTNPHTEHAHVGYLVAEPITTTSAARRRPVEYAADIQRTLTARMGADYAYNGVVTRNPLHKGHATAWGRSEPYTLGELHKPLGKLDPKPSKLIQETGLGRNVALFDSTRGFAYRAFNSHDSYDSFYRAVTAHALSTNAVSFDDALAVSEARCVARSVARWTWETFSYNKAHNTYSETQRKRAMRRADYLNKQDALHMIRGAAQAGHLMTAAEIMAKFDVSERTARTYISEAGLVQDRQMDERIAEVTAMKAQGLSYRQITERTGWTTSQIRHALRRAQA